MAGKLIRTAATLVVGVSLSGIAVAADTSLTIRILPPVVGVEIGSHVSSVRLAPPISATARVATSSRSLDLAGQLRAFQVLGGSDRGSATVGRFFSPGRVFNYIEGTLSCEATGVAHGDASPTTDGAEVTSCREVITVAML
jgi:hypothetical protein